MSKPKAILFDMDWTLRTEAQRVACAEQREKRKNNEEPTV